MKISVIIPLYNKERHIERTLQSVLEQSYKNYEIIVIDDGSTDKGPEIVKNYLSPQLKLLTQKNRGVSAARNRGLKMAEGDLLTFLDADDTWQPEFLETIASLYNKYPEAGLYATSYQFKEEDGGIVKAEQFMDYNDGQELLIYNYFRASFLDPLVHISSLAVSREFALKVGGFDPVLKMGEDTVFQIRLAVDNPIVFKNIIGSIYHRDAENRVCRNFNLKKKSKYNIEKILEEYGFGKGSFLRDFRELVAKYMIGRSRYFILAGDRREAARLLWKYRDTKYFKKQWFKYFLALFVPNFINKLKYSGSWEIEKNESRD